MQYPHQDDQYDQVSLVVGVVEEGGSKEGRKGSKDEVRRKYLQLRKIIFSVEKKFQ